MRCGILKCRWAGSELRRGLCAYHYQVLYDDELLPDEWEGDVEEMAAEVEACARPLFVALMLWLTTQELVER